MKRKFIKKMSFFHIFFNPLEQWERIHRNYYGEQWLKSATITLLREREKKRLNRSKSCTFGTFILMHLR